MPDNSGCASCQSAGIGIAQDNLKAIRGSYLSNASAQLTTANNAQHSRNPGCWCNRH